MSSQPLRRGTGGLQWLRNSLAERSQHHNPLSLSAARPRLTYLDNLRWVLITSVVLIHLSVTYGVPADWTYYEGGEVAPFVALPLLLVAAIGANFAMGLFFLIAGYFTPAAYGRKGTRRFLIEWSPASPSTSCIRRSSSRSRWP